MYCVGPTSDPVTCLQHQDALTLFYKHARGRQTCKQRLDSHSNIKPKHYVLILKTRNKINVCLLFFWALR